MESLVNDDGHLNKAVAYSPRNFTMAAGRSEVDYSRLQLSKSSTIKPHHHHHQPDKVRKAKVKKKKQNRPPDEAAKLEVPSVAPPTLKDRSYLQLHRNKNETHVNDREKASSIVHNLVYDPKNPDITKNPLLNRKPEAEPKRTFGKQSLYLCGQSDKDLSQLLENNLSSRVSK